MSLATLSLSLLPLVHIPSRTLCLNRKRSPPTKIDWREIEQREKTEIKRMRMIKKNYAYLLPHILPASFLSFSVSADLLKIMIMIMIIIKNHISLPLNLHTHTHTHTRHNIYLPHILLSSSLSHKYSTSTHTYIIISISLSHHRLYLSHYPHNLSTTPSTILSRSHYFISHTQTCHHLYLTVSHHHLYLPNSPHTLSSISSFRHALHTHMPQSLSPSKPAIIIIINKSISHSLSSRTYTHCTHTHTHITHLSPSHSHIIISMSSDL